MRLADLTTLRLGGPAHSVIETGSAEEIVAAVSAADRAGRAVLLVGGGSNLVVSDDGFDGDVVLLRSRGVRVESAGEDRVRVTVAAGEPWDDFVVRAVGEHWAGLECLSGIPGLVGATPVQNVGAYGAEVAQTVISVELYDRTSAACRTIAGSACGFAYRTSIFKHSDRWVVLSVTFELPAAGRSAPITYTDLARALDVGVGESVPLAAAREAVLAQRRARGMVLDPGDHDTWSAGSFFTNPIVPVQRYDAIAAAAGDGVPHWPDRDGTVKLSAAWLIQHAGYGKGYGVGSVTLSTKHTLALTNRGGATSRDLVRLAREIRDGVHQTWGVELSPEPLLVGVDL